MIRSLLSAVVKSAAEESVPSFVPRSPQPLSAAKLCVDCVQSLPVGDGF